MLRNIFQILNIQKPDANETFSRYLTYGNQDVKSTTLESLNQVHRLGFEKTRKTVKSVTIMYVFHIISSTICRGIKTPR